MKPPKFHVGQAVECLDDTWRPRKGHNNGSAPRVKKGCIYIVAENIYQAPAHYVALEGLPEQGYSEKSFAPVDLLPDEALAELLAETLEPVTA